MTQVEIRDSLVEAIDSARSQMEPEDEMVLCRGMETSECHRESGCSCPIILGSDPRSTHEIIAQVFGVRQ